MDIPQISHPAVRSPSVLDLVVTVLLAAIIIPTSVCSCLVRRVFYANPGIPLWRDAMMSIMRNSGHLPLPVRRSFLDPPSIASIVESPHFRPYSMHLCERVKRDEFAGFWLSKGAPHKPQHPRQSDIVVLFLHGGAYVLGHPLNTMPQLLCAVERAATEKVSVSLFSLQYTRAPETPFPAQFDQTIAAYQYLLEELKVQPSRVVVMGESAGGHLALAFLHQIGVLSLPKPGGAFLVYPWVDLSNQGASFVTNQYRDMLVKSDLDRATGYVMGRDGWQRFGHLVNLAEPRDTGYWKATLPQTTHVTVGTHDVFLSSILSFTDYARSDGAQIQLDLVPEAHHGYTVLPDMIDSKAYLRSPPRSHDTSIMKIASTYAQVFVRLANTINSARIRAS